MQVNDEKVTEVRCILCRKRVGEGLNILGRVICCECERRIVALNVTDDTYDYYVERIKSLWIGE